MVPFLVQDPDIDVGCGVLKEFFDSEGDSFTFEGNVSVHGISRQDGGQRFRERRYRRYS